MTQITIKTKILIAMIALVSSTAVYSYSAVLTQINTAPVFAGSTEIFAKYNLTINTTDPSVVVTPPVGVATTENTCHGRVSLCEITFSLSGSVAPSSNSYLPTFQIGFNTYQPDASQTAIVPQVINSINVQSTISLAGSNVSGQPMTIHYNFVNNVASALLSQLDSIQMPPMTTTSNTCSNVLPGKACSLDVTFSPSASGYETLPQPDIITNNQHYPVPKDMILRNAQTMLTTVTQRILVLTPNTVSNSDTNQLLLQSADQGSTWVPLNLDLSVIKSIYKGQMDQTSFLSFSNIKASDNQVFGLVTWNYNSDWRGTVVVNTVGSNQAWQDVGTPTRYPLSMTTYSEAGHTYLFVVGRDGLWLKDMSVPGANYQNIYPAGYVYDINHFTSGKLVLSADQKKLYFIGTGVNNSGFNAQTAVEWDLSNGITHISAHPKLKLDSPDSYMDAETQGANVYGLFSNVLRQMPVTPGDYYYQEWPAVSLPAGVAALTAFATNSTDVFIATTNAAAPLYRSNNSGASWTAIPLPADAVAPLKAVAMLSDGVLQITDNNDKRFIISL